MTDANGIIDLTDEVVETAPDDDTVIELTEVVSADDEIIELDEVADADAATDSVDAPLAAEAEMIDLVDASGENEVVELIDASGDEASTPAEAWNAEPIAPAPESVDTASESDLGDVVYFDDELEAGLEEEEKDDFVESLGMEIEDNSGEDADDEDFESEAGTADAEPQPAFPGLTTEEHAAAEIAVAQALAIPEDQLDAAIEKAVENAISGKIETILAQVVEKAVTREIEKIKKALLDDLAV